MRWPSFRHRRRYASCAPPLTKVEPATFTVMSTTAHPLSHVLRVLCVRFLSIVIKYALGRKGWGDVNVRAREHSLSLRSSPSWHLAVHCIRCACARSFANIITLAHAKKKKRETAREIDGAFLQRYYSDIITVIAVIVGHFAIQRRRPRFLSTQVIFATPPKYSTGS